MQAHRNGRHVEMLSRNVDHGRERVPVDHVGRHRRGVDRCRHAVSSRAGINHAGRDHHTGVVMMEQVVSVPKSNARVC